MRGIGLDGVWRVIAYHEGLEPTDELETSSRIPSLWVEGRDVRIDIRSMQTEARMVDATSFGDSYVRMVPTGRKTAHVQGFATAFIDCGDVLYLRDSINGKALSSKFVVVSSSMKSAFGELLEIDLCLESVVGDGVQPTVKPRPKKPQAIQTVEPEKPDRAIALEGLK